MPAEGFDNLFHILQRHRLLRGGKAALICQDAEVSYVLLDENVSRFGNLLKDLGVMPRDRVLIALPDCPDCVYAFLGSLKCGAWPVLVRPDLSERDCEFILRDSQPAVLVTVGHSVPATAPGPSIRHRLIVEDEEYRRLFAGASTLLDPVISSAGDSMFMLYTMSSTGEPRGVPHCQSDMLFCAENYAGRVLNVTESDVLFSASKMSLSYGLGNSLIFPLYFGATAVLFPHKPAPDEVFREIIESRPTIFFGVPTLYSMMLKTLAKGARPGSVRLCVSAGEALPASIYREWKDATGLEIIDGIGSTETLHIFISNRPGDSHPGSSGQVVPPYEAQILGEDGLPAASGQAGLLLVRGGSIARCYYNRPDMTAETMLEDGWLRTGDVYTEEEGWYTYLGRADNMFKSGGNWVSPSKVEEILRGHPLVLKCAVASLKLENLAKPVAYVVPKPGVKGDAELSRNLRSHVLMSLPKYMCPVEFIYCEELPKARTG